MGEKVDFKIVRGEMAKLEPRWTTGTFLGRTDESDEVIVGTAVGVEFARSFRRRTRDKQRQRDAFTTFTGVTWNSRGLAVEAPMASNRRRYITKSLVQRHGETPGCLFSMFGSFVAAHDEVPREIRAAESLQTRLM